MDHEIIWPFRPVLRYSAFIIFLYYLLPTFYPIKRFPMQMSERHNHDRVFFNPINDPIRETLDQTTAHHPLIFLFLPRAIG